VLALFEIGLQVLLLFLVLLLGQDFVGVAVLIQLFVGIGYSDVNDDVVELFICWPGLTRTRRFDREVLPYSYC
jgi:hypothetical protein